MKTSAAEIQTPDLLGTKARVWFVGEPGEGAEAEDFVTVGACCRFYGLEVVARGLGDLSESEAAEASTPVAVVVGAGALSAADWPRLAAWLGEVLRGIPVLIVGVDAGTDKQALWQITEGLVCEVLEVQAALPASIQLCADRATAGPLAGQRIPAPAASFSGLRLGESGAGFVIGSIAGAESADAAPCCVRLALARGETWVAAASAGQSGGWHFEREHFGRRPHALALALMFLRNVGKDRCWQAPALYANLCIDDPWLTEPYGRMSYPALLAEAQRAGFHATVGFVPWNYDRSAPAVVDLIARNRERLSIVMHGNNHDRFEFYGPQRWREGDPWRVKPLAEQEATLRQAVARMEAFSLLTGLPYDRVMVFPHAIGSAGALRLLKRLGLAGTANYNNFPLGSPPPTDLADCLSAVNSAASGFPALRRDYPKNRAEWTVALDLFLGNPVLFMAHEDLFDAGAEAFNDTAALVTRLEPSVRWTGLGEIFRGLYRQRRLRDDLWEIQMLSDEIDLRNEGPEPRRCWVRRDDPHDPPIEEITVNGAAAPMERREAGAAVLIHLAPGETRRIVVGRQPEGSPAPRVELRRRGLRNRALRAVAEFRDLRLSGTPTGRWLTRLYYANKLHRVRWHKPRSFAKELWSSLKAAFGRRPTGIKS